MSLTNKTSGELLKEADALFQDRNYADALPVYDNTYQKAREEFNRPVEVESLSQLARLNLIGGKIEAGRSWLEKARERVSPSDLLGWSRFLGVEGRFDWKAGNLKTAKDTFEQMFEYCVAHSLWGRAVDAAHMVAIVAENIDEQIKWTHQGIQMAEAHGSNQWLGPLWNNLGGIYHDNKQFALALESYLKARQYHWQYSGESSKLFADYHVGMTYRLTGQLETAAKWLRPVLAWAERIENHSAIGQCCEDLGEIEIAQGKKEAGLQLLKRAREEFQIENFAKTLPHVWENINKRIAELGG